MHTCISGCLHVLPVAHYGERNDGPDEQQAKDAHDPVKIAPPPGAAVYLGVGRSGLPCDRFWGLGDVELGRAVVALDHVQGDSGRERQEGCDHPRDGDDESEQEQENLSVARPPRASVCGTWRTLPHAWFSRTKILFQVRRPQTARHFLDLVRQSGKAHGGGLGRDGTVLGMDFAWAPARAEDVGRKLIVGGRARPAKGAGRATIIGIRAD